MINSMPQSTPIPVALLAVEGVLALVAATILLTRFRFSLVIVGGMFFASSIALAGDWRGHIQKIWLYPIQLRRSDIFVGLGALLFVTLIAHMKRMSLRSTPVQGVALLSIGLYAGLLRFVHEGIASSALSLSFTLVTILPLLFVLPALLRDWDDWLPTLRMLMWVNAVWIAAVLIQAVLNHHKLVLGRGLRFTGLMGNPQHAAMVVATFANVAMWLLLNDTKRRFVPMWAGFVAANLLLTVWTGSRTGMLATVVGAMVILHRHMGKAVLLLPVAGLLLWVLIKVVGSSVNLGADRLVSTQNTRGHAWMILMRNGQRNPLFGVGVSEAGDSENSFLYGFASYGVGMVFLQLLLFFVSGVQGLRLMRWRSFAPPELRAFTDLIIAYFAMYFAGSLLEGYMIARVAAPLMFLLFFGSLATSFIQNSRMSVGTEGEASEEAWWGAEEADRDEQWEWGEQDGPLPGW